MTKGDRRAFLAGGLCTLIDRLFNDGRIWRWITGRRRGQIRYELGIDPAPGEDVTVHELWKRGPDGRMAFYAYRIGDEPYWHFRHGHEPYGPGDQLELRSRR